MDTCNYCPIVSEQLLYLSTQARGSYNFINSNGKIFLIHGLKPRKVMRVLSLLKHHNLRFTSQTKNRL